MINPFTGGLDFSNDNKNLNKQKTNSTSEIFARDINENFNPVDSE
jgi:hypothetical protein